MRFSCPGAVRYTGQDNRTAWCPSFLENLMTFAIALQLLSMAAFWLMLYPLLAPGHSTRAAGIRHYAATGAYQLAFLAVSALPAALELLFGPGPVGLLAAPTFAPGEVSLGTTAYTLFVMASLTASAVIAVFGAGLLLNAAGNAAALAVLYRKPQAQVSPAE